MSILLSAKTTLRTVMGIGMALATAVPSRAQAPSAAPPEANAEEVVVTARRAGIPVWNVASAKTSVVLVGAIGNVAPGTRWDPKLLDAALASADRVMFPETLSVSAGLFTLFSALAKWRKQATLPKGQTLRGMTTPEQWARLVALREKGVLKPGFERKHPFHLAVSLHGRVRDKRKLAPGAEAYVRRFLKRNKAKPVPLAQASAKAIMAEFFGSAPRAHVACLMDAVTLVEAGQAGVQARSAAVDARSRAWAARRVPDAVASAPSISGRSCLSYSRFDAARRASLGPTVRGLMNRPQVTMAVISLDSLAERGGVLDDLVAAGFEVRGPRWRN